MPIITIKSSGRKNQIDLAKAAQLTSEKSGIAVERFFVIAEYHEGTFFNSADEAPLIIHIAASERNSKETIQKLMFAAAESVAEILSMDDRKIPVYVHPIQEGYLALNKEFI